MVKMAILENLEAKTFIVLQNSHRPLKIIIRCQLQYKNSQKILPSLRFQILCDVFLYVQWLIRFSFFLIVHPCDLEDQGGCAHVCNKRDVFFDCSCNEGFKFRPDNKTCVEGKVLNSLWLVLSTNPEILTFSIWEKNLDI